MFNHFLNNGVMGSLISFSVRIFRCTMFYANLEAQYGYIRPGVAMATHQSVNRACICFYRPILESEDNYEKYIFFFNFKFLHY